MRWSGSQESRARRKSIVAVVIAATAAVTLPGCTSSATPAPVEETSSVEPLPEASPTADEPVSGSPSFPGLATQILIRGEKLQLLNPGDSPMTLIDGRVAAAIDDGAGGLLFQYGHFWPGNGQDESVSIVWWVPKEAGAPQELLVPAEAQAITLMEVADMGEGEGPEVLYIRSDAPGVPEGSRALLRAFSLETSTPRTLALVGGWEWGVRSLSASGDRIVTNWVAQVIHGVDLLDATGLELAAPAGTEFLFDEDFLDCGTCPRHATLSSDGAIVWFTQLDTSIEHLVGIDMTSGDEVFRRELPGRPAGLDASGDWVLVNSRSEADHALLVNVGSNEITELPAPGEARFVAVPIEVSVPLAAG